MQELRQLVHDYIVSQLPGTCDWDLLDFYSAKARKLLEQFSFENPAVSLYGDTIEIQGELADGRKVCVKQRQCFWETKGDLCLRNTKLEKGKSFDRSKEIIVSPLVEKEFQLSYVRVIGDEYWVMFTEGHFRLCCVEYSVVINLEAAIAITPDLPNHIMESFNLFKSLFYDKITMFYPSVITLLEIIMGAPIANEKNLVQIYSVCHNKAVFKSDDRMYELSIVDGKPCMKSSTDRLPRTKLEDLEDLVKSRFKVVVKVRWCILLPFNLRLVNVSTGSHFQSTIFE